MPGETKLCKHCKMEIPKDAKVCPHCRKKQGGKLKWIIVAVVAIAVIAALAGGGSDDKPKSVENDNDQSNITAQESEERQSDAEAEAGAGTDAGADAEAGADAGAGAGAEAGADAGAEAGADADAEEKDTFGVGESAELNDVQVTMTSYEESAGSEYNKPADGNEFVLVEFEIVNNSDGELSISSMMSFEAYADDYALNYSLSALMEKEGANQLDGSIAAGKRMKGIIGYEVPADWQNIEIHFTDNVWSSDKFKFLIER